MPLLRKKEFQKSTIPELLRDDEEVFHCAVTNEIFRDYDEFCQRIILVNSMVWSCAMTGKSNLTYAEALQSEQTAKKSLKDFPMELRIPVLFLASKTKRSAFGDMAEDVFSFIKDRYFVGENVESCFTENNWRESYVLQVIAPSEDEINAYNKSNNMNSKSPERNFSPPAALFRYEVEQLDANDQDSTQVMIIEANHVRRKKGPFTKEKLRLFLKQFVELKDTGLICIKESVKRKYKFESVRFDQLFDGPIPEFEQTKRVLKTAVNGKPKKVRQESIANFLTKNPTSATTNGSKANGKLFMEEMKRKEAEYKQKLEEMKQKRIEERIAERQKRKEESIKIATLVKDWNRPRDDLLLEDQKSLPSPVEVQTKIPACHFGDALMLLEFVNSFQSVVSTKDFFPGGLTLELIERALTEKEVAGPLTDLILMLLNALFNLQDAEATENNFNQLEINHDDTSLSEDVRHATVASNWSIISQGLNLTRLPLFPVTVSEVLRLHLLSSGANMKEPIARWRYQQRGGYTNDDDPGLYFRRRNPHILKALIHQNVNVLPIEDKIQILTCLVDQLLTYADVRDTIEERIEKTKTLQAELKALQINAKKIETDFVSSKFRIKKEHKSAEEQFRKGLLDKLEIETERKRSDNQYKVNKTIKQIFENQPTLGMDRSFQKYIKIMSLPGFFVDNEEQFPGVCLDRIITQKPELIDAGQEETVNYVKQLNEENSSSDKENDNGLKKTPKKINGARTSVKNESDIITTRNLQMCTANNHPCPVHSNNNRPSWGFYHQKEDVDKLISSLNKRGVRESELRETLETDRSNLEALVADTYAPRLNPNVEASEKMREKFNARKIPKALRYEDSHLGYPIETDLQEVMCLSLIDSLLEMEEKIHTGSLGALKVKDRDAWRKCLTDRHFDKMDKTVMRRQENNVLVKDDAASNNGSRPNTPDSGGQIPKKYLKVTLATNALNGVDYDDSQDYPDCETVQGLKIALAQVAQAVELKYLTRPLGSADKKAKNKKEKQDLIDRWEQSLMSSTNYSQLFLHYCTLDSCVMWRRSILFARCQLCRRLGDSENMLLCDGCNQGYHTYCLKPKLPGIPAGDWFCDKCKPTTPRAARKARKIFTEEDDDDEQADEEDDSQDNNEEDEDEEDVSDEEDADYGTEKRRKNGVSNILEVCEECGSGGRVICCDFCPKLYHLECAQPPLRRVPRGEYKCHQCSSGGSAKNNTKKTNTKRQIKEEFSDSDSEDVALSTRASSRNQTKQKNVKKETDDSGSDEEVTHKTRVSSRKQKNTIKKQEEDSYDSDPLMEDVALSQRKITWTTAAAAATTTTDTSHLFRRRCATQARSKIHGFARTLRRTSVDSGSGEEYTSKRRSTRRAHDSKGGDGDLPLNNAALQELLADVMKHKDAWPFTRPVTKQEVPDYFDVIKNPMDFGTIKYKLNMGEYHHDAQVMCEAALVFENCDTYNHSDADVYKCGVRLLKYFEKRSRELGFNFPKNVMGNVEATEEQSIADDDVDDGPSPPKKIRT